MKPLRWTTLLLPLLLLIPATPAASQQRAELTDRAAASLAAFYNREATIRLHGETRVAPGTTVDGDVASVGGPLIVTGTVRGDVVVMNGDLRVEGGRITGTAIVAGGAFVGDTAAVAGGVTVYPEALRLRREAEGLVALGPAPPSWLSAGLRTPFGRTDFMVTVDGSYNRVEGLPITFGPRIELGQSNPTVLDARLVYRTRSGLRIHPEEFGHVVRLEQYLGGHRAFVVGLAAERAVDPIERPLTDVENSLSTFILHRDYRDHYERRGYSAYLRYIGRTRPFDAAIEYRDETHASIAPADPWSLLDNDESWRLQSEVGEGEIRTVRLWGRWDTRNDRRDPATGWLVEVEAEQGLEGDLSIDQLAGTRASPIFPLSQTPLESEFTAVRVDARRYLRLGPRTRVAIRALVAGSPDDGPLPPQRQHVLGGEGSLPGYERFELDCGARDAPGYAEAAGFFPYYGCDRQALLQGELRFTLDTGLSLGTGLGLDFDLLTSPEIVLFADAGRAWIEPESLEYRDRRGPSSFVADAGVGLRFGRLGLYLAAPVTDGGDPNFFVRLGPRI